MRPTIVPPKTSTPSTSSPVGNTANLDAASSAKPQTKTQKLSAKIAHLSCRLSYTRSVSREVGKQMQTMHDRLEDIYKANERGPMIVNGRRYMTSELGPSAIRLRDQWTKMLYLGELILHISAARSLPLWRELEATILELQQTRQAESGPWIGDWVPELPLEERAKIWRAEREAMWSPIAEIR